MFLTGLVCFFVWLRCQQPVCGDLFSIDTAWI